MTRNILNRKTQNALISGLSTGHFRRHSRTQSTCRPWDRETCTAVVRVWLSRLMVPAAALLQSLESGNVDSVEEL